MLLVIPLNESYNKMVNNKPYYTKVWKFELQANPKILYKHSRLC